MARQSIYLERDSFQKNVVCTVCHSLTTYEDSWTKSLTGKKITKYCKLIAFPNHTQKPRRKECGNSLMKSVVTCSERNYNLCPKKVYPYRSIKSGLEELLSCTEFRGFLFEEPNRSSIGRMSDIYDGCLWKEFRDPKDQQHFFTDKRHLGVMLNLDWFNPYKNKEHSVGVIYLSILNLPRTERFKFENSLIIGIIPGPKEPSLHVNSYISPMVEELLLFWEGQLVREPGSIGHSFYRIALLAISSDIPATRKFCGFLSFNAEQGMGNVCWYCILAKNFHINDTYSKGSLCSDFLVYNFRKMDHFFQLW